jgi:hypothetical protein
MAVERASAGAEVLARRLLSVARKQPLRQEEIHLQRWFEDDAALIRTSLGDRVSLSIGSFADIWPVHVDASELQSALINLAVNAKDAMPDGGEFIIRGENVEVAPASGGLKPGEYVVIACTDTGVGMTRSVAQRAFEPLFTTKTANAGNGARSRSGHRDVRAGGRHGADRKRRRRRHHDPPPFPRRAAQSDTGTRVATRRRLPRRRREKARSCLSKTTRRSPPGSRPCWRCPAGERSMN